MATSESPSSKEPVSQTPTLESSIEKAKRAFALRKFEEAVDYYATALEIACVTLSK
jgi:HAT1-interacting factor 1